MTTASSLPTEKPVETINLRSKDKGGSFFFGEWLLLQSKELDKELLPCSSHPFHLFCKTFENHFLILKKTVFPFFATE